MSGGTSLIGLKSYSSGREKFQAETLDWVWYDEEPPADIYTEGLTRTNTTGGPVWMTFTPLLGVSEVVRRFILEKSPDRHVTSMTIDDAEHLTPELRARIIASFPRMRWKREPKAFRFWGRAESFRSLKARLSANNGIFLVTGRVWVP